MRLIVAHKSYIRYASSGKKVYAGTLSHSTTTGGPGNAFDQGTGKWRKVKHYSGAYDLPRHNRRYGRRYRHRSGSKYTVRKSTQLNHSGGTIKLKPGDKVAINGGQGTVRYYKDSWIRVDGYYRWGIFHETKGGRVFNSMRAHPTSYHVNFS